MALQKEINSGDVLINNFGINSSGFFNTSDQILIPEYPSVDSVIDQADADRNQIVEYHKFEEEWEKTSSYFAGTSYKSVWNELEKLSVQAGECYPGYSVSFFLTYEGSLQFILTRDEHQLIMDVCFEQNEVSEAVFMEFQGKKLLRSPELSPARYHESGLLV